MCRLRERFGLGDGSCGTISGALHEIVVLLKTTILSEEAGRERRDSALAKALRLDE